MPNAAKFVVLQLLRAYKWVVSPWLPPACRFVPTCSEYATEAVERYGALRGGGLALLRLLRCHPFSNGGYDPVVNDRRTEGCGQRRDAGALRPGLPGPGLPRPGSLMLGEKISLKRNA